MSDYIAYPARGTGTTAGIRMSGPTWHALKAAAEVAGAPNPEGVYDPLSAAQFSRAAVRVLAAALAPQAGVPWGRVPANVPVQAPASPLAEPTNFARATAVIALFAEGQGVVVEKVSAAEHRANTR